MRASWEALHAGFDRSVRTLQAKQSFQKAKAHHPALVRFAQPHKLVEHLTSKSGELDEKDRIFGTLVTLVQRREQHELANALLWLGLWPGLDAIHHRRTRHFLGLGTPDDLAAEIAEAFTEEIAALDLTHVHRVAATLVRSTERRVLEGRTREWTETSIVQARGDIWALDEPPPACRDSRIGLPPTLSHDEELAHLRAWLQPMVGQDAELVLAVLVLEETQREAGARLGLSHEAARKRFQRAFARIRQHAADSMSQFAFETRV